MALVKIDEGAAPLNARLGKGPLKALRRVPGRRFNLGGECAQVILQIFIRILGHTQK